MARVFCNGCIPNELFPTEVRATAVGIAIGFSRIGTIAATYGTPLALTAWGVGPVMLVAAGLALLGLVLSYFMAPETRGKSLAETSGIAVDRCVGSQGSSYAAEDFKFREWKSPSE